MADALKGNLAQLALLDILRLLSSGKRTGLLDLQNGTHRGEIYLNDGAIVHAATGAQIGQAAIYSLLGWPRGEFAFTADTAAPEVSVQIATEQLLDEAAKRAKEWAQVKQTIPSMNIVLTLCPTGAAGVISLQPDDWQVLAQINGVRTLAEIATMLNRDEFAVAKTGYGLIKAGLVTVGEQVALPTQAPIDTKFFTRLEQEFVDVIGPLGPIIIETEIAALGESKDAFPRDKVGQLVERVSRDIEQEDKRLRFQQTMLNALKNC